MSLAVLEAFRNMTPRAVDAEYVDDAELKAMLEAQIVAYPSFALPDLRAPVVICGFVHFRGVCECWMVTGIGFERGAPVVLQQQITLIGCIYDALKLHRMEMEVYSGDAKGRLWAERLGFVYEGTRRRGGPRAEDLDVYRWSTERE